MLISPVLLALLPLLPVSFGLVLPDDPLAPRSDLEERGDSVITNCKVKGTFAMTIDDGCVLPLNSPSCLSGT